MKLDFDKLKLHSAITKANIEKNTERYSYKISEGSNKYHIMKKSGKQNRGTKKRGKWKINIKMADLKIISIIVLNVKTIISN